VGGRARAGTVRPPGPGWRRGWADESTDDDDCDSDRRPGAPLWDRRPEKSPPAAIYRLKSAPPGGRPAGADFYP